MTRLSVAVLHMFLAVASGLGALWILLFSSVNATWEQSFYGVLSDATSALRLTAVFLLILSTAHGGSAVMWFAGNQRAGWLLVGITVFLLGAYPAPVALLMAASGVVIFLDVIVEQHRQETPPE